MNQAKKNDNADLGPLVADLVQNAGVMRNAAVNVENLLQNAGVGANMQNAGVNNNQNLIIDVNMDPNDYNNMVNPVDTSEDTVVSGYVSDIDQPQEENNGDVANDVEDVTADDNNEVDEQPEHAEDNNEGVELRRSTRPHISRTIMQPAMSGKSHNNVQLLQSGLDEKLPTDPILLHDNETEVFAAIMTQVSLRKGIRLWGDKGREAAMKEMTQLHDMSAFFPRDPKSLTREERIKALSSLIFLKQKRTGQVKGRLTGPTNASTSRKKKQHHQQ